MCYKKEINYKNWVSNFVPKKENGAISDSETLKFNKKMEKFTDFSLCHIKFSLVQYFFLYGGKLFHKLFDYS